MDLNTNGTTLVSGTIKFFNDEKGYGFITQSNGSDVFLHISACPGGSLPKTGDKVEFTTANGDRGIVAENVTLLN